MLSLFLHRTSAVHVNLFIASTTLRTPLAGVHISKDLANKWFLALILKHIYLPMQNISVKPNFSESFTKKNHTMRNNPPVLIYQPWEKWNNGKHPLWHGQEVQKKEHHEKAPCVGMGCCSEDLAWLHVAWRPVYTVHLQAKLNLSTYSQEASKWTFKISNHVHFETNIYSQNYVLLPGVSKWGQRDLPLYSF